MREPQIRRYARHISLESIGFQGQSRILGSTASIALGGDAASHCALVYLAASGVGRLAVTGADQPVDENEVFDSLVFEASDIGALRFDAIASRIGALNPDVVVARRTAADPEPLDIPNADDLATGLSIGCEVAARFISSAAESGSSSGAPGRELRS